MPPISSGCLVPVEAEPMAAVIADLRAVISNNEVKTFGGATGMQCALPNI